MKAFKKKTLDNSKTDFSSFIFQWYISCSFYVPHKTKKEKEEQNEI